MTFLCIAFAAWTMSTGALATTIGPVADLHIKNANVAPDGFMRSAVLAGESFPGPVISGNKGDEFRINVINELEDQTMLKSTSIHWHGFFQKGTPWADGPSFVSQCPVSPGESFLYTFSTAGQAGTFWYHSHLSTQYCDGLRGPLVVYDTNDPHKDLYTVDNEQTIITLADWYPTSFYLTMLSNSSTSRKPNTTLINGLGRYAGGPATPLAIINVLQGTRYRFRLISMACHPNYVFSIDGHAMTVIEADGVNTKPVIVDSIQIFAGQRYSFVVNANQDVRNYWVRALPNMGTVGYEEGVNKAILRYFGAPIADPNAPGGISFSSNPLLETDLHPLENPGAPGAPDINGADLSLSLQLGFNSEASDFTVNGETFVPPTIPVLLQILSGAVPAASLLPSGTVYPLPLNKVIQISMPALDIGGPHPFHLHGHNFDVIRSAGSSAYNYENPVRRDVVSIGMGDDNVTIRFVTDNSGPWFLHCHIDWHLEMGLAVVFAEDIPGVAVASSAPDAWKNLCPIYSTLSLTDKGGII
ncbi:laccase [Lyophyllum atratum]|nr:laccase [Lyophyllum atratum]